MNLLFTYILYYFQTVLISSSKITDHIESDQLTHEFGGKLSYDHEQWLKDRISFETYVNDVLNERLEDDDQNEEVSFIDSFSYEAFKLWKVFPTMLAKLRV